MRSARRPPCTPRRANPEPDAGVLLDHDLVAALDELERPCGRQSDAVLARLDLPGDSDPHRGGTIQEARRRASASTPGSASTQLQLASTSRPRKPLDEPSLVGSEERPRRRPPRSRPRARVSTSPGSRGRPADRRGTTSGAPAARSRSRRRAAARGARLRPAPQRHRVRTRRGDASRCTAIPSSSATGRILASHSRSRGFSGICTCRTARSAAPARARRSGARPSA